MKYVIIPYIALGLVLSLAVGIEYNCSGQEMFPTFYGSPFVFKKESLGSSMEYFYSISGLAMNMLTWSAILFTIFFAVKRLTQRLENKKLITISYRVIIAILLLNSTLNIAMDFVTVGNGFSKELNYWSWYIDKEAKDWEMTCKGELITYGK